MQAKEESKLTDSSRPSSYSAVSSCAARETKWDRGELIETREPPPIRITDVASRTEYTECTSFSKCWYKTWAVSPFS